MRSRPAPGPLLHRTLFALVITALLPTGAPAQGRGPHLRAEILPGWQSPDGRRMAALRLEMPTGWHTYWRIPGDAGIAPQLDWSASQNVAQVTPIWPRPQVFEQNGYISYGYEDELILPLEITPRDPARPVALVGALAVGVCSTTCVPADLSVSGALRGPGGQDTRIERALATRAVPPESVGLSRATCRLEPAARGAELTLRATLPRQGAGERLILDLAHSGLRVGAVQSWRESGELVARAQVRAPEGAPVTLDRGALAYTILSDTRMIAAQGCSGER